MRPCRLLLGIRGVGWPALRRIIYAVHFEVPAAPGFYRPCRVDDCARDPSHDRIFIAVPCYPAEHVPRARIKAESDHADDLLKSLGDTE